MLNQVVLIGRLTEVLNVIEEDGKKKSVIKVAVLRCFKNEDGIYDTDIITVHLWNIIAENVSEYCTKGDLVGIKGRLETLGNGRMVVIGEKITFLSSKRNNNEDNNTTRTENEEE